MIAPAQLRKLALLAGGMLTVCLGLAWRLVDLQVFRHEELRQEASRLAVRQIRSPLRGDILDTHGNPLATSLLVKTVVADLKLIGTNHVQVARLVAGPLRMSVEEAVRRMTPRMVESSNGPAKPLMSVVLKRKVMPEQFLAARKAMLLLDPWPGRKDRELSAKERELRTGIRLRGIVAAGTDDQLRVYPGRRSLAHVLGYTRDAEDEEVDGRPVHELEGMAGIERQFDGSLRGTPGWRRGERIPRMADAPLYRREDVAARPGLNVVLTIDAAVQHIVETEIAETMEKHNPEGIYVLVIRPATGEILAMASLPNFDPNHPGEGTPIGHLRNRIVSDRFEPGSTFKTLVIAGAVDDGVVRLEDVIDCEHGQWFYGGYPLRDAGHRYGKLSVADILAKSSNIGAAKVGIQAGRERVYDYLKRFGILQRTGILLPAEGTGSVPALKDWKPITVSRVPIGQGVAMTPLQVSMAICSLANGGRLMAPLLVRALRDEEGVEVFHYEPRVVRQVVSEETARGMVEAMERVATTNGTGKSARMEFHTVAGKTGTGQKPPYDNENYFASFIGFFPSRDPQVFISVFVDAPDRRQGYYGSETAAPTFRRIAERLAVQLGIPPDREMPGTSVSTATRLSVPARAYNPKPWTPHAAQAAFE